MGALLPLLILEVNQMQKTLIKQTLRIFWQHASVYPRAILLLIIAMLGAVVFDTYGPFLYKQLFNSLIQNGSVSELLTVVFKILAVGGLSWCFWRLANFANDFFQPRIMSDIVNTCFKYMHDHSYNFFTNNFAGSLVKKVGRFERAFEDIADQLYWNFGHTILKIIIILIALYFVAWQLSLALLVWMAVYLVFSVFYARFKYPYDIRNAKMDTEVAGRLADTITNNINLKLFGGTAWEFKTFQALTEKLFRIKKLSWNLGSINEAVQGGLMVLLEFALLYLAVKFWKEGRLTIGDFALIQGYMVQVFGRLWDLGRHIKDTYSRLSDAEEMTEILTMPHGIQDRADATRLQVSTGSIEFRGVNFGYHEKRRVFKNFSLSIQGGERVALIGPSGGGKTTIVKLLFRFFDMQGGGISIDGQNIAQVTQESLRANISLVPQEPILFHRSLYDNIAYAKPQASEQEVYRAAKLAHCHEFIMSFPLEYETFVGERGLKLSGGERQRVAIARAILKDSPILVLDEATSSLDSESEHLIQDAMKKLMLGKTTIVIAHRLSTIMQMDRIIVIDKGQVAEEGKHTELIKAKQGIYQKLWQIQAGGFAG